MPRKIESLFLAGAAGRLEALLEEPDQSATGIALVCHPHPQHGGTMHNKVVYRVAKGLRRSGHVVMRFNYRGVNLSEGAYAHGEGELDDARIALDVLTSRYPALPLTLAGFSFGSRIALRMGCAPGRITANMNQPGPRRVIAVGFPTVYKDRAFLDNCTIPRIFIQSTRDQFGPVEELRPLVEALPEPKQLIWIDAQDHFFAGALEQLEESVIQLG
jgi:alpha/beta superfamily hydrolase